jgi:hypothetical protein
MEFGRKILEGYLVVAIAVLTVVTFIILSGVSTGLETRFLFLAILMIILIAVNIIVAIINLRILDEVGGRTE